MTALHLYTYSLACHVPVHLSSVWLHRCFIDDTAKHFVLVNAYTCAHEYAAVSLLQCTVIRAHVGYIDIALGAFVAGCTLVEQLQSNSAGQVKEFCANVESLAANCRVA
jgi:hypothetical protein